MAIISTLAELSSQEGTPRAPYVLFPIQYPESSFWTADEIDLALDRERWCSLLTEDEHHFLSFILGFFTAADGIVMENLVQRFCAEVDVPEVRCFYRFQMMMENMHSEVYSRLVQEHVEGVTAQEAMFHAMELTPAVRAKGDWCTRWTASLDAPLSVRIMVFAIVEGVFFALSFAALFWLQDHDIMHGMTFSNELIARDEGQHVAFACMLYHRLGYLLATSTVRAMMGSAVQLEKEFFENTSYIEYVGDFLLVQLGHTRMYHAESTTRRIRSTVDTRTKFFEHSVSNYHGASVAQQ
ncbi:putative ribonucleoside-diphosphate reductase small chain B [Daedaleopsis nitida]|nr:putative ribonucleoside-diphosphate reductase small chain B [Daedaleopsis nitida]